MKIVNHSMLSSKSLKDFFAGKKKEEPVEVEFNLRQTFGEDARCRELRYSNISQTSFGNPSQVEQRVLSGNVRADVIDLDKVTQQATGNNIKQSVLSDGVRAKSIKLGNVTQVGNGGNAAQSILSGVKCSGNITIGNVTQRGGNNQTMASNITTDGDLIIDNLSQIN